MLVVSFLPSNPLLGKGLSEIADEAEGKPDIWGVSICLLDRCSLLEIGERKFSGLAGRGLWISSCSGPDVEVT